jgi:hypothetical protein
VQTGFANFYNIIAKEFEENPQVRALTLSLLLTGAV